MARTAAKAGIEGAHHGKVGHGKVGKVNKDVRGAARAARPRGRRE